MSTKMGFWRWALASAAVAILTAPAGANLIADPPGVTTNTSAGIVVFPKIQVDTSNGQFDGDVILDTHIQLTNTSNTLVKAVCYYVNANGHCSNDPGRVCTQDNYRDVCEIGGLCVEGWREQDFHLTLTKRQPVSWNASTGEQAMPLPPIDPTNPNEQTNQDSNIIPVPEVPFIGELRCVQVDVSSELPLGANDLKGEASIVSVNDAGQPDASKYDAIGIPAIDGAQRAEFNVLNIGGPEAEYNGCPNILTLNHFFDGAELVTHDGGTTGTVTSRLTVVPCAADFHVQELNPASATLQFLIYNEFEQRFSTSTRVTCYRDVQLSDIDTRPGDDGNEFSIFSFNVQGTLTGQSRIRAVQGVSEDGYDANGVLAIIEETHTVGGSDWRAAANIQYQGTRVRDNVPQGDLMILP